MAEALVSDVAEAPAPPYLRWRVADSADALVGDVSITVQGPRNDAVADDGNDNQWQGALAATVKDNAGQSDYVGADLDPEVGMFLVKQLADDVDPTRMHDVAAEETFRVQAALVPEGFAVDTEIWLELGVTVTADEAVQTLVLAPVPAKAAKTEALEVTPLAAGKPLVCGTGYFYSVSENGTLNQVQSSGLTVIGQWSGVSAANSVAIGAGGTVAYAVERSGGNNQNVSAILRYTQATNTWATLSGTGLTTGNSNSLVAGAVNLSNGNYLFGGFDAKNHNGNSELRFMLYSYNGTAISTLGYFWTGLDGDSSANGDMAFDSAGNLYVVRSGSTTNIFTVTAATLAGANGGALTATSTNSMTLGLSSVNGIAFETDGTVYLGNGSTAQRYNPTNWTTIGSSIGLDDSTDLASCNSPVNLTVKKNVISRAALSDQFRLSVKSGATETASALTTGTATGIQLAQIGPIPVVAGNTYTIGETISGPSLPADYAASYVCTSGATTVASGSTMSGSVTMPNVAGASVVCIFTNTGLASPVSVKKTVLDAKGLNPQPGINWSFNAAAVATVGTVAVSVPTRDTDGAGTIVWPLKYSSAAARADVTVSEAMQPTYEFVSGSCVVTAMNGTTRTVTMTSAAGNPVTGVAPGEKVDCAFTNKLKATTLTLIKSVTNDHGGTGVVNNWVLTATGPTPGVTGRTTEAAVTNAVVEAGKYSLSEAGPTGYTLVGWTCLLNGTATNVPVTNAQVTLAVGTNVTCTVVNNDKAGEVTWSKVAKGTTTLLAGSEWKLNGTSLTTPTITYPEVAIIDCAALPCGGADKDPAAGKFNLPGLKWGNYTLTETKAPPGYLLDTTPHTFTVSGQNAGTLIAVGAIDNTLVVGPAIPLTGGIGRDQILLAGGGILILALMSIAFIRLRGRRIGGTA